MSVKVFNTVTNRWEQVSTTIATGVKVVDLENKLDADNVNDSLLKVAADLKTLTGMVQYINESGTIGGGGGGGGGGGSSRPLITLFSPSTVEVTSDEKINVEYFFSSPNSGVGTVTMVYGSSSITRENVRQGPKITQQIGPFVKSPTPYSVIITATDVEGFSSVPVRITVVSGSLDLTSTFNDGNDFTVADPITISYTISTFVSADVFLDYWIDGTTDNEKTTVSAHIGANTLTPNFAITGPASNKLQHLGPTFLKMQVHNSLGAVSNSLTYSLVAADSSNLYLIAVSYPSNEAGAINIIHKGSNLVLDYRVSMKNQFSFNTGLYIDDVLKRNTPSDPGVNKWNVGVAGYGELLTGSHFLKIITTTLDGQHVDQIVFRFDVAETGYTPYTHVSTNLIAQFDAVGKFNTSVDNDVWADTSGHGVACDLHDFNYTTNGWNNNALDLSGKSYAVIDLAPFLNNISAGFTFEVLFKTKCVGNVDAKVVSCRNALTPFQGFDIDTRFAEFQSSNGHTVKTQIQEDTWTKVSFVVNRGDTTAGKTHTMLVYVNGAISFVSFITPGTTYAFDGLIYLGAEFDGNTGTIINNSASSIKSIRIYDRALTDLEVVRNYIADITDPTEQVAARNLNSFSADANPIFDIANIDTKLQIPRMDIVISDITGMGENSVRTATTLVYEDPSNQTKSFTSDANGDIRTTLSWQGTSSLIYPVKNWTIKLEKGGKPWLYTPRDDWLPDLRWTLKANYMDSSNANNIGLQKYIRDYFKTNVSSYPSELPPNDPLTRPNVDGFPVYVTMNGDFIGIYTWNIDRYGLQNNGFVTYDANGVEIRRPGALSYEINVNSESGAGAFHLPYVADAVPAHATANWNAVATDFRCRYSQAPLETVTTTTGGVTILKDGSHPELLALVQWVNDADDEEFAHDLKLHFSIPHLIDYYLVAYIFGMVDNLGKNMVLSTWDTNATDIIWYPSFYDCDSVLGLDNTGLVTHDAGVDPMIYIPKVDVLPAGNYNTSRSNLWIKLVTNPAFTETIQRRYEAMRQPRGATSIIWFSAEQVMRYLGDEVMDKIGPIISNLDARVKFLPTAQPPGQDDRAATGGDWFAYFYEHWTYACNGSRRQFTERWLNERFIYLDSVYEFSSFFDKIQIRSNVAGPVTLKLKTYSPQWVRISFSDAGGDTKAPVRSANTGPNTDLNGYKLFETDLDNPVNNNIEIYGANNIMFIDGINTLNADSVNMDKAQKLVELDVSFSPKIQVLTLGANSYLQRLSCNDCTSLGDPNNVNPIRELDVSNCINLRQLNFARTHINNVKFNAIGGVIDTLDGTATDLTSFSLIGQDYLTSIALGGCANLSTLQITNCRGLKNLIMPNTKLATVRITGCFSLAKLDLRQTKNLTVFDISGCPNLEELYMIGVANINLTELDLSYAPLLKTFDMSASGYISYLKLPSFPALHTNEKLRVTTDAGVTTAKLSVPKVLLNTILVRLDDTKPAIPGNAFTTAFDSNGFVTITFPVSASIPVPADLRWVYVSYQNTSCLSSFLCNGSAIKTLKFGRVPPLPNDPLIGLDIDVRGYPIRRLDQLNTLDLTGLPLNTVDFGGCGNLIEVRNINYIATTGSAPFRDCASLKNITGVMTLVGSIGSAFYNCRNLVLPPAGTPGLPIPDPTKLVLNLTGVTSMVDTFWLCTSLTAGNVRDILQSVSGTLTDLFRTFGGCTGIVSTLFQSFTSPALFNKCTNVTRIQRIFSGCSGITGTLPAGAALLAPMPKVTDAILAFQGTQISGTIPSGFFDGVPLLSQAWQMFWGCNKLTGLPNPIANLFRLNTELTSVGQMFYQCSLLQVQLDASEDIFVTNKKLVDVQGFFQGCPKVTGSIPARLFNNVSANSTNTIKWVNAFFTGTGISGSIPDSLFDECVNLEQADDLFNGCTNLTGSIPPTLFLRNTKLTRLSATFANCRGLTGTIPPNLLRGKTQLTVADRLFLNCVLLDSEIPRNFLLDCPNLTDISSMFSGCSNLHGVIPVRDSYWTAVESFDFASKIILPAGIPDVGRMVVKIDAGSPALIRDVDYKVIITNPGTVNAVTAITIVTTALKSLATFLVNLPHSIPLTLAASTTATIPSAGVNISTLVVRNFDRTPYVYNTDYTLSIDPSGDNLITVVPGGGISSEITTIYVEYDYTAPVDRVAVLDTNNIDISAQVAPVVRAVIDSETANITTKNLVPNGPGVATDFSTVMITGLSGADTCIVKVSGAYSSVLTPQTSTNDSTWTNVATNALTSLNPNDTGKKTFIPGGTKGAFSFSIQGKTGVRISSNGTSGGTATVAIFACGITATAVTHYTLAINTASELEITRARVGNTVIPFTLSTAVVTFRHTDVTMADNLDIVRRAFRPSLIAQNETVVIDTTLSEYKYGFLDTQINLLKANNVFWQCWHSQFNGTIPPKLFLATYLLNDIAGFFGYCWYLSGWLPPTLLYNCPAIITMANTFQECLNLKDPTATYLIPPKFFDQCPNLEILRFCFNATNPGHPQAPLLAGVLDKDLFKFNPQLKDISSLFSGLGLLTGPVPGDLFKVNVLITDVNHAFWGTGITAIEPLLFRTCVKITNMTNTFWSCTKLFGYAPAYWASDTPLKAVTAKAGCFSGDTHLTNYTIPEVPPNPLRIPNDWGNVPS